MPVAELTALLTADNKQFNATMDESVKKAKKAGKEVESVWSKIGASGKQQLAGVFAVGALTAFAGEIGAFASDIKDLSETLGQSSDEFQQFSFAVSQSGGSQEVFVKAMLALGQSMEDAKNDTGKAGEAFTNLGLTLDDISGSSPADVFLKLADAIKEGGAQGANFAALADILGVKIASKMVPSLNQGSDGFLELARSATIAGKEAVDAAEEAQDTWDAFLRGTKTLALNSFNEWFNPAEFRVDRLDAKLSALPPTPEPKGTLPLYPGNEQQSAGASNFSDIGVSSRPPEAPSELIAAMEKGKKIVEDMNKEAQEAIDDENDRWERQSRAYQDIQQILNETSNIELETARSKMSDQEMFVSLEKERVELINRAKQYEQDIFGLHMKDAALLRQQAARVSQRQSDLDNADRSTAAGVGVSGNRDANSPLGFGAAGLGPIGTNTGSLTSGGLTSGGLTSGGLGGGKGDDAWGKVRSGDRARAKSDAKREKDPQLEDIHKDTSALLKVWTEGGKK